MTGTQYLQVPKALPYRRGRSRSKSRSQDTVSVEELCIFQPSKKLSSPPTRPASPQLYVLPPQKPMFTTTETALYPSHQHKRTIPSDTRSIDYKLEKSKPVLDTSLSHPRLTPAPTHSLDMNGDMYTLEDTLSPPPRQTLRQKIIGAWKLESYVAYPTPESTIQRQTYPMTKNVTGFIMYTPDGYMAAQMLIPGQQSFKRGEGEEPQWAEAAKRCFAYCGPYYITDEGTGREEVLRHTFQVCNLPGWIGDIQVRTHRFEEDGQVLVLGSEEPSEIKGDKRVPELKWRRARDNATGVPPPPMPSIEISGPAES